MKAPLHQSELTPAPNGSPEAQAQRNEQLLGMFEASFMNGDLLGAMSTGQEMLGIDELRDGDYPYSTGYTVDGGDATGPHMSVRTIDNDKSGLSSQDGPVAVWQRESEAGRPTSPAAISAMQTVLRDHLGRYNWHYDNAKQYQGERGNFVGTATLGSDLRMRASEYSSRASEQNALTGFMRKHGYVKGARYEESRLLQWCENFAEPEDRGRARGVIGSLLNDDPRELSRQASTEISAPQMIMEGLSRARGGDPYAHSATSTAELAEAVQRLGVEEQPQLHRWLTPEEGARGDAGEAEFDSRHPIE